MHRSKQHIDSETQEPTVEQEETKIKVRAKSYASSISYFMRDGILVRNWLDQYTWHWSFKSNILSVVR